MAKTIFKTTSVILLSVMLVITIFPGIAQARPAAPYLQEEGPNSPLAPGATTKLYLPIMRTMASTTVTTTSMIGTETCCTSDSKLADTADNANINIVRLAAFSWKDIEPTRTSPATYDWSSVNTESIKNLASRDISIVATIRFAPSWAQKYPPYSCGPIAENAFDAFVEFVKEAARIYSQPPYNIKYWEIGNEPDVQRFDGLDPDNIWGCWGEVDDPYFGGGYYAKVLEKVYPALKSVDPSSQLVIGGLLLDCDPTNPPDGKDCTSGNFLEGILNNNGKNNGANYFDIVSFHGYPHYYGSLALDETYAPWAPRGGIVLGKADFLREVMARYNVDKPLYHSEGSLLCPPASTNYCNPPGSTFYEAQADYVVWLYVRNWAANIMATSWYTLEGPGWYYSSLLDSNQNPKPAYNALQFLTNELNGADFVQQFNYATNVRVYEFKSTSKDIWVMWAPDDQSHTITLPSGVNRIFDKYGNAITPTSGQRAVKSPIYLEMAP